MMDQLTLDDAPMRRTTDPDTCQPPAPAQLSAGRLSAGRLAALDAHRRYAAEGLTDFELAKLTGKAQTSIGKRRGELTKTGLIEQTDARRPSPSGAPAVVWRITQAGIDVWRSL